MSTDTVTKFAWPSPYIKNSVVVWLNVKQELNHRELPEYCSDQHFARRVGHRQDHSSFKGRPIKLGNSGHLRNSIEAAEISHGMYNLLKPYILAGGGTRSVRMYTIAYNIYDHAEFTEWLGSPSRNFVGCKWKKKYHPHKDPVGFYVEGGIYLFDDPLQSHSHMHEHLIDIARALGDIDITDEQRGNFIKRLGTANRYGGNPYKTGYPV